MMYRTQNASVVAVSQPAHAWISGRLMRAWREPLSEPLLLAIEQHDVAWLDWEVEPPFDASTGRPQTFRDVPSALHAPMWEHGVARANAAWGPHVALLISRHGAGVYQRFGGGDTKADAAAVAHYQEKHARRETEWAAKLGLDAAELDRQSMLLAFADVLSLAICGALPAPLTLEAPLGGEDATFRLDVGAGGFAFSRDPWPFAGEGLDIEGWGRALPASGRFGDEGEMRRWLKSTPPSAFSSRLSPA